MSARKHRVLTLSVLLLTGAAGIAIACGPDFPWQLLDRREVTLAETPANPFAWEAAHLVPAPTDMMKAVENRWATDDTRAKLRTDAETAGLAPDALGLIAAMRAAGDGDKAYALGEKLPAAVRLYTAAAVDYKAGRLDRAAARFQAVLDLPAAEGATRAVWAAYMLGRAAALRDQADAALAAFAKARALAQGGAPDPLGLAVASLGEEARVRLAQAGLSLVTTAETDDDTVADSLPATLRLEATKPLDGAALSQAISLYAQQAAHDSYNGVSSLNIIALYLLENSDPLKAAVTDPLVQRLLAAHVLAFEEDLPRHAKEWDARRHNPSETYKAPPTPHLAALTTALAEAHIGDAGGPAPAAADQLAALAYRKGDYDLAGRLAAMRPGPLASWVQAKLALQKGDLAQAADLYAQAAAAFPTTGDSPPGSALSAAERGRLAGEGGTVALARGEYVAALDQLMPMADTYWGDVAHIAERVLTVDELKAYVDAKVPASVVAGWTRTVDNKQWPNTLLDTMGVGYKYDEEADRLRYQGAPLALRSLLARRLMRAGRGKEALAYYHNPAVALDARAYLDAREDAGNAWWAASRARAWFQAAQLARTRGMEIMGTEGPPDEAALDGAYDFGIGQAMLPPAGATYVTDGERKRFADSAPQPDQRYHYRFIATDAAEHAADQLPRTSQAYAATLCWAVAYAQDQRIATWTDDPATIEDPYWQSVVRRIIERDNQAQGRVAALYQRYVRTGPHQAWAAHFGRACPAPDFDAAAKEWWQAPARQAHRWIRHNHRKALVGGAAILAVLAAGTALLLVRRRRRPIS
ncbi:hypothetical protein FBZ89_110144 [Nitrospirillum amazonense]|uniref:Tetratricopeptide repeat protein n=1 Tax=Nitrospirillum amazonense TaxID=28077 RepID=A0A560FAC7_9PROT|nr:hypothetical protein [Nitrospirillum amazonense]TWB18495.1 hypothetical protein FBZ89_110144 [Nitrospirillum amazonense]